ncbi:MYXO-CTERM sorting domain-containing protein [uncultured Alsobacter sp.]
MEIRNGSYIDAGHGDAGILAFLLMYAFSAGQRRRRGSGGNVG